MTLVFPPNKGLKTGATDAASRTAPTFGILVERACAQAVEAGFQPRALHSEIDRLEATLPSGAVVLETHWLQNEEIGDVRIMHMTAPRVNVVSLFLLPNPDRLLPIYAMEFVEIASRPILAVADALAMPDDLNLKAWTSGLLRSTHDCFHVVQAQDAPAWFIECRSGQEFFCRPSSAEGFATLTQVHDCLFEKILRYYTHSQALLGDRAIETHGNALTEYMRHHGENSPGRPLLQKTFGSTVTEKYLRGCYFNYWFSRESPGLHYFT